MADVTGCEKEIKSSCQRQILTSIIDISTAIVIMIFDICALAVQMMAGTACKRFQGGLGRLNKVLRNGGKNEKG